MANCLTHKEQVEKLFWCLCEDSDNKLFDDCPDKQLMVTSPKIIFRNKD